MIKTVIKTLVFTILSIQLANYIVGGLSYTFEAFILIILALTMLILFLRPISGIVGLPSRGIGYMFLFFVLSIILLYSLSTIIPFFYIKPATLSGLVIYGYALPSKSLSIIGSSIFSALLFVVVYTFFDWLSSSK